MANKKNIVICWNDDGFVDKLNESFAKSKDYNVTVFTSFEYFEKLGNTDSERRMKLKEYDGFVVLCELQWNHNTQGRGSLSDFLGIALVQGYLRREMGLKAPVVFTSFMDAKEIVKQKPDYSIIMTPALQHEFVRLPSQPVALVESFAKMRFMSDTELVYTQMQYCDILGLLRQIKHNSEGRKADEQELFRSQVRYVIEKQFPNNADLIVDLEKAKDVSVFCELLMKQLSGEETDLSVSKVIDFDYACERESEQLRTLILEDDPNDVNVNRFIEYIVEQNKLYNDHGKYYLFNKPTIVSTKRSFDSHFQHFDYHVVICDIEIREDEKLTSLGFNIVTEALKLKPRPLYYIVTNVTRSLYEQIKKPGIRRVLLKNEVFREGRIHTFLYGIKEIYEQRKKEEIVSKPRCEQVFDRIYNYLSTNSNRYEYVFNWDNRLYSATISTFDELEKVIKLQTSILVKEFIKNFSFYLKYYDGLEGNEYNVFDKCCEETRNYIKKIMSPNTNFVRDFYKEIIADEKDPYRDPTNEHLEKFTIRLILRRFFFYVRLFIEKHNIFDFDDDPNSKKVFTISDFACRSLNFDFKEFEGESHGRKNDSTKSQGRALDLVLLISSKRKPEYQTDEEKAFLECVGKMGDRAFPLDEKQIEGLNFNY